MEEKRIYYVGIDHGNHLMKTSNHVFENGVERQAVKPTFQANTLVYDGAFYKIGEKRNSVKDSKLADDDYYLLTLAVLLTGNPVNALGNGIQGGNGVSIVINSKFIRCVPPFSLLVWINNGGSQSQPPGSSACTHAGISGIIRCK